MRINIFETSLDGHRARYLRDIIQGICASEDGIQAGVGGRSGSDCIRLCMPESLRSHSEYIEYVRMLEDLFEFCPVAEVPRIGKFREERLRLRVLVEALKSYPCDRLILPYGDGLVPLMGLLPFWLRRKYGLDSIGIDAIVFRPSWVYPSESYLAYIYHGIRGWSVRRWLGRRLCFSDRNAWDRVSQGFDRYAAPVALLPEMLEDWELWDRQKALEWLEQNEYLSGVVCERLRFGKLLSMPGSPSLRKGAVPLTEAFVKHFDCRDVSLLYWGGFPSNVEQHLEQRKVYWREDPRVFHLEKPITDAAFQALFSLTDAICLPYQNDRGVSSIFLLSAIHQKRVLCDDRGWLGWARKEYGHGLGVRSSRPESIAKGLKRLIWEREVPIACRDVVDRLRSDNSQERFQEFWQTHSEISVTANDGSV